jgi:hypothetical protein
LSLSPQVLIERSMKGWKELEYEVVRDAADVSALNPRMHLIFSTNVYLYIEHHHLLQHGELRPSRHAHW